MKHHYDKVIADLRSRIASTIEELTRLDAQHSQLADRRVELQSDRVELEDLLQELEIFAPRVKEEPPTPEPEEASVAPTTTEIGRYPAVTCPTWTTEVSAKSPIPTFELSTN